MGSLVRGVHNAFRNWIRTSSIVAILGLSVGLAVVMLLALMAVDQKIATVKSSIGNTITISPAGARGFEGGGNPLMDSDLSSVKALPNVVSMSETLQDRLRNGDTTTLQSAVDPGTLGQRAFRFNRGDSFGGNGGTGSSNSNIPTNFSLPITVVGTSDPNNLAQAVSGSQPKITSGSVFAGDSTDNVAVVGSALATKNNLKVGSTFSAYSTDIKVVGIFDAGNQFANSGLAMPIKTVQKLSQQDGQVSSATVQVSSIDQLASTTTAIKNKLGDKADVVSAQDTSDQALAPLQNIRTISLYSLIGAVAAGAVVILMTMLMIVRERRREIGVLKAIGASNWSVLTQFITEAVTFTGLGTVLGLLIGVLLSNRVLQALVSSASTATTSTVSAAGQAARGGGSFAGRFGGGGFGQAAQLLGARNGLSGLQAQPGWELLLYGVGIALLIAIIGSAVPAYLSARVKPAEVLRGE